MITIILLKLNKNTQIMDIYNTFKEDPNNKTKKISKEVKALQELLFSKLSLLKKQEKNVSRTNTRLNSVVSIDIHSSKSIKNYEGKKVRILASSN